MKKLFVCVTLVFCLWAGSAMAQSLSDIARQSRKDKKANPSVKLIDNDLLPSVPVAAVPEPATDKKDPADKDKSSASAPGAAKDQDKKSAADTAAADQKNIDLWKQKIDDQKREISQLQRELDVSEREARLRAAAYYGDAGTQLRDETKFAEETRKTQAEIDTKKQALADAKQKLQDLEEAARKAGVPSNQLD